jgi:nicotinate-nucleotide pyrophosphorylase (carboxylating)
MKDSYLLTIVKAALAEDLGAGDVTTNHLVPSSAYVEARLVFKSEAIVCGLDVAEYVFKTLNKKIIFQKLVKEGTRVKKQTVAVIKGPARAILSGERVAINFLTHLSAIATKTRAFVDSVKSHSSKIYDTRKTTPLLRPLERYAVRVGGAENHRFNLSTMAMIKDNHRLLLQHGLKQSVQIIKRKTDKEIILEVDTLEELKEALTSQANVILLDNMTIAQVRHAVVLRNKINSQVALEASGGINLKNVAAYAKAGVERISVGTLTSVREPIDISLDFIV